MAAVRAEATGTTGLSFRIGADGSTVDVEVVHPSGPTREHRLLDESAARALRSCRWLRSEAASATDPSTSFHVEYVWEMKSTTIFERAASAVRPSGSNAGR